MTGVVWLWENDGEEPFESASAVPVVRAACQEGRALA
jgi:hypothetical protein